MRAASEELGTKQPKAKPKSDQPKKRKAKKCKTSGTGTLSRSSMSKPMAELIVSDCKTAALDRMYGNPPLGDLPECNCSGCAPESETGKHAPKRRAKGEVHLTKEMRESATTRLVALRRKIFITEVQSALTDPFFVLPRVLPNELIFSILDVLPQFSWDDLNVLVDDDEIAKAHAIEIWTVVLELQMIHQQQLKQKADGKAARKMYVSLSHPIYMLY
jgi:hypothetical protein